MSLTRILICAALFVIFPAGQSPAQLFTDQGMMSGSGLSVLPTATTVPAAEMQAQVTRISFLSTSPERANIVGLTLGLSTSIETYVRMTSEELHTSSAQMSYSFGGKFRYPEEVPLVRRLALWIESTFSDMNDQSVPTIFPTKVNRAGFTASLDSNGFRPTLFFGGTQLQKVVTPMGGAGFTVALGHRAQLGAEGMWGYLEKGSIQAALTGSVRIYSNISLHVTPGYIKTNSVNGLMFSAGFSLSSADVDYHQVASGDDNGDQFHMPSIDDLEKDSQKEKKE
jgi:hypothetical protein